MKGWKTKAEVVSEAVEDSARAEHAKFVGKFAMNRVDVVVEVHSGEAAEFCVAKPNEKSERGAKRENQGREISYSILAR